jgi:hypothetical protein
VQISQAFTISGWKFYDGNGDGLDNDNARIAGWTIYLDYNPNFTDGYVAAVTTDGNGNFDFTNSGTAGPGVAVVPNLTAGTWYVYEGAAPNNATGWLQTHGGGSPITGSPAPPAATNAIAPGGYKVILTTGSLSTVLEDTNLLSYQGAIDSLLSSTALKGAGASGETDFGTFNGTRMQMMNDSTGQVFTSSAGTGLTNLGFISLGDLMLAANDALGLDYNTWSGDAATYTWGNGAYSVNLRDLQNALETALDAVNNNQLQVVAAKPQ